MGFTPLRSQRRLTIKECLMRRQRSPNDACLEVINAPSCEVLDLCVQQTRCSDLCLCK